MSVLARVFRRAGKKARLLRELYRRGSLSIPPTDLMILAPAEFSMTKTSLAEIRSGLIIASMRNNPTRTGFMNDDICRIEATKI